MYFDDEGGDWEKLERAIGVYGDLFPDPAMVIKADYFIMWRRKRQQQPAADRPRTALAALDHCSAMYPNMCVLLQRLKTLPITTAQAERFFSKMERLFTAIRAIMEEDRSSE